MMKYFEITVCLLIMAFICCFGLLFSAEPRAEVYEQASGREAVMLKAASPNGNIRVNHAAAEELEKIPGIGPVLAQAIVDEREAHGSFHYAEDLMSVRGIGEKTLEQIRAFLDLSL